MADSIVTIDMETEAIGPRPHYPPKPVGVAVREGRESVYYAWGHPTGNNCTFKQAQFALKEIWRSNAKLLFHHSKFDLEVAEKHMGLPIPDWRRVHDTLYLLFLADPHAPTFSLKPSAERYLNLPPTEQEAVRDWLIEQKVVARNSKGWGAYIAQAPGDLVGRYAIGDVERTYQLFHALHKSHKGEAYDRERQLMPILLRNEQQGLRVDLGTLEADVGIYQSDLDRVEAYVRRVLKAPALNLDADRDLADVLQRREAVTTWGYTATGQPSVAKDSLKPGHFKDPRLAAALGYRNRLKTCLSTFMEPWLRTAQETDGVIYPGWNQTRGERGGARTGRLSSSPNFQNIPKSFEDKNDGYVHPKQIKGLRPLPLIRRYILPDAGQSILHRDYNQQELRILAHFEDGALREAYTEQPRMDIHDYVRQQIKTAAGLSLERRAVKVLNFGMLYGMGLGKLAESLGISVDEAREIKQAQRRALPGVASLDGDLKRLGRSGQSLSTFGGRKYYCEPPQGDRTFEYKLLNYLIQGSAADCTKQALINYDGLRKDGRFMLQVHDELNVSVPTAALASELELLREAMESVRFDVPMLTDAKVSSTNWGSLESYNH